MSSKKYGGKVSVSLSKRLPLYIKKNRRPILFSAAFATIGIAVLSLANAGTLTASFEAEDASPSHHGITVVRGDNEASGGGSIKFGSGSTTCADGPNFTSANICINQASVQAVSAGYSTPLISSYGYSKIPVCYNGEVAGCRDNAAFRTDCGYSHTSKNDPIVFPGQSGAAHWHVFFGNTAANENLTTPATQGNSTCNGGILNRTAYWAPALIDTSSYNPTTKTFNLAQVQKPNDTRLPSDPEVSGAQGMQAYYKTGYRGANPAITPIQWFPVGLRMIAGGNPNVAPTGPVDSSIVFFDCIKNGNTASVWGTEGIDWRVNTIPTRCPPGYYIQATIEFPQCGANNPDGTPMLDSANHRSHMAYGLGHPDGGCPTTHPRVYPSITEHFRWKVPANGAAGLRFSSDMYPGVQPGWTFHADWWNGWDNATSQSLVDNCYSGGFGYGYDCQVDLLGTPHSSGTGFTALGYNDNR